MTEQDTVVVEDGWHSNQRIVVLNSTGAAAQGLGAAALGAARDSGVAAAEYSELESLSRQVALADGDLLVAPPVAASRGLDALGFLERTDALIAATPLRPSRPGDTDFSEIVLHGAGQVFAAGVEALRGTIGGDTDVLGRSILLEFDSPQSAREAHAALAADLELVTAVEQVPARWLEEALPAEVELPFAPWHLPRIRGDAARRHKNYQDASEIDVAVLDSGIDEEHPFLKGAIASYSYASPRADIRSDRRDIVAHGTHVAGTIAANGPPGNVEGISRCRLHPYKIVPDNVNSVGRGYANDGTPCMFNRRFVHPVMYLRALQDSVDSNFPVINLSLSGSREGSSDEKRLFKLLVEQGQIVVAAMGNTRREGSPPRWPAKYPGVVAVGALDFNDQVARFSNGGDHITISAPGVDILSTMPTYRGVEAYAVRIDPNGNWFREAELHWVTYRGNMSGTSMATPQVAAAAALWTARHGRDASAFVLKLQQSARKLSLMKDSEFTPDYGYGCLDIDALL